MVIILALGKWFFIDPQFSIYVKKNNVLLNYKEIYDLVKTRRFKLSYIQVLDEKRNNTKLPLPMYKIAYKTFIKKYFLPLIIKLFP